MTHPSLQKEKEQLQKIVEIPKEKLDVKVIVETLRKLKEQIEIFPEFYERLSQIGKYGNSTCCF